MYFEQFLCPEVETAFQSKHLAVVSFQEMRQDSSKEQKQIMTWL
jgi:hypothetical protein